MFSAHLHRDARPASHLPRLVNLRWLEVVSQLLVLFIATHTLGMALPSVALLTISLSLAAANIMTWWRLSRPWPITDLELFGQLGTDVIALGCLLYLSGGSANPFVSLLLLPLTIAATTLAPRLAWLMAGLTIVLYTVLMFHSLPLPEPQVELPLVQRFVMGEGAVLPADACHADPQALTTDTPNSNATSFALHILGMWLNFLVSGLVVAFFLTRMTTALRERERELALARESALRHEQILALGTLAAGAAHQLGTPLSTLAVLLREMELEHGPHHALLAEDLGLARQQVSQCKQILSHILADAGPDRDDAPSRIAFDQFLDEMLDHWQLLRPGVKMQVSKAGPQPAPTLRRDRSLEHALLNLLDNAADASPQGIELDVLWHHEGVVLKILDHGPGLDAGIAAHIGRPFFSTKGDGLGIGLFLSNATVERFGGRVELYNREPGGACTQITLPLKAVA